MVYNSHPNLFKLSDYLIIMEDRILNLLVEQDEITWKIAEGARHAESYLSVCRPCVASPGRMREESR